MDSLLLPSLPWMPVRWRLGSSVHLPPAPVPPTPVPPHVTCLLTHLLCHPPALCAGDSLTYGELREQSKLPDEDLTRCLASLTLSKYKLLTKVGAGWGLQGRPVAGRGSADSGRGGP